MLPLVNIGNIQVPAVTVANEVPNLIAKVSNAVHHVLHFLAGEPGELEVGERMSGYFDEALGYVRSD
jgi:hypothetical protein